MTSPATSRHRTTAGQRRTGYAVSVIVNAALLYLINVSPGWTVVPFLTTDMSSVLPWINASLALSILVNAVYIVADNRLVKGVGDLLTLSVGLVALIQLWQVFPFDFGADPTPWPTLIRLALAAGIIGTVIGIIVACFTTLRSAGRNSR